MSIPDGLVTARGPRTLSSLAAIKCRSGRLTENLSPKLRECLQTGERHQEKKVGPAIQIIPESSGSDWF
jgi:hypothetical protein